MLRKALAAVSCALLGLAAWGCNNALEGVEVFQADLAGANEVPPVGTSASGGCGFQVEGQTVHFSIETQGINAVIGSHIHVAAAGVNGPIRVVLYPNPGGPPFATTATGTVNGVLLQGTFGPQHVSPITFEQLLTEMRNGNTYCNVHTTQNRGGEIRGQIRTLQID